MSLNHSEIKRAVEWLYRTRIKEHPDSIEQIASETGESAQTITAHIAEADSLLSQVGPLLDSGVIQARIVSNPRCGDDEADDLVH